MADDKLQKKREHRSQAVNGIALVLKLGKVLIPAALAGGAYAAAKVDWPTFVRDFFLGPGRWSRIAMMIFTMLNWKAMPFVWTYRVWKAAIVHLYIRSPPPRTPKLLFAPIISESRPALFEIDYNLHKSNSTYFSDLDVTRTQLVSYLLKDGFAAAATNATTKLILDPSTGEPARGSFGISLGAAHCTWHREIPPGKKYEVWTRVLSWDRKWFYMVTHYVPSGLGRPSDYFDKKAGKLRKGDGTAKDGWEKKIYATAISKYVFKLARLTIHPALLLQEAGLLPERPGGWVKEDLVDVSVEDVLDEEPVQTDDKGDTTWEWVEWKRQRGMGYAKGFLKLDELSTFFEGGSGPAIGVFNPC